MKIGDTCWVVWQRGTEHCWGRIYETREQACAGIEALEAEIPPADREGLYYAPKVGEYVPVAARCSNVCQGVASDWQWKRPGLAVMICASAGHEYEDYIRVRGGHIERFCIHCSESERWVRVGSFSSEGLEAEESVDRSLATERLERIGDVYAGRVGHPEIVALEARCKELVPSFTMMIQPMASVPFALVWKANFGGQMYSACIQYGSGESKELKNRHAYQLLLLAEESLLRVCAERGNHAERPVSRVDR